MIDLRFTVCLASVLIVMAGHRAKRGRTMWRPTVRSPMTVPQSDPWPSVNHALDKVGGGHTIIVKPGVYSGVLIRKHYAGTAERPTVIKSEKKWGAVLTGETNRGFDNDTGADWITVDGFEVVGGAHRRHQDGGQPRGGPQLLGPQQRVAGHPRRPRSSKTTWLSSTARTSSSSTASIPAATGSSSAATSCATTRTSASISTRSCPTRWSPATCAMGTAGRASSSACPPGRWKEQDHRQYGR